MTTLNRAAARTQAANVCSATDITGFGLLGHAVEMALPQSEAGTQFSHPYGGPAHAARRLGLSR